MDRTNLFATALKQKRRAAGVTLGELARAVGKSVSYVSDVEHGRRNPFAPSEILAAAACLRADERELLDLAARSVGAVRLEPKTDGERALAVGLARRMHSLTAQEMRRIMEILDGVDL